MRLHCSGVNTAVKTSFIDVWMSWSAYYCRRTPYCYPTFSNQCTSASFSRERTFSTDDTPLHSEHFSTWALVKYPSWLLINQFMLLLRKSSGPGQPPMEIIVISLHIGMIMLKLWEGRAGQKPWFNVTLQAPEQQIPYYASDLHQATAASLHIHSFNKH